MPPFYGDGTGSKANYKFGFEYINRADVEVYVGDILGTKTKYTEGSADNANEYEWKSDSEITLNATGGTKNVIITRVTDMCDPYAEFFTGAITSEDLNGNQEQALFLAQELEGKLALYWSKESANTIKSTDTWINSDDYIGTTAAIDQRYQRLMAIGDTPPSSPQTGLIWFNTDCAETLGIYVFDGTFWVNASTPGKDGVSGGTAIVSKTADVNTVEIGALWYNSDTSKMFCCVKNNAGDKVWAQV